MLLSPLRERKDKKQKKQKRATKSKKINREQQRVKKCTERTRAITIWETFQKRSYKTKQVKRTTFAIANVEDRLLYG